LLQNADDAGVGSTSGCKLRINLSRDRLLVASTGRPFEPKGLTSLVVSDCSPKQLDHNRFIEPAPRRGLAASISASKKC
jgi:hypothetical protein